MVLRAFSKASRLFFEYMPRSSEAFGVVVK
jgi:hypothetical protein